MDDISVFSEVFSDFDDNFLKVFLEEIVPLGKVIYSYDGNAPAAQGFVFPIFRNVGGEIYKGLYLYGLSTLPKYRKQGRMSEILSKIDELAEIEAYDFTFLATDNCEAKRLYTKNGYEKQEITPKCRGFLKNNTSFEKCSVKEYIENTSPSIYPQKEMRKSVIKALSGFSYPAKAKGGYFLVSKEGSEIIDYFPKANVESESEFELLKTTFLEDEYDYFLKKINKKMPDIKEIDYILD